eukprot:CAMPEP_0174817878 /NCGR_PEP_ID=MMETSP1107-20130205/435_1 /TAXON_ID=36770 /ORGANISM="Paraphysomonas vestita, Strain GFlagA" /LENGTH=466 /DNA_ID=CAMNT_0016028975 /DNA_START=48 /DNA_END=1448 /DNA_ORIENTATION=+
MPKAKKYIFEGGVMKINPDYIKENPSESSSTSTPIQTSEQPLAIISSMEDVSAATIAQQDATGLPMNLAPSTVATFDVIQDDSYVNQFQAGTDGADLLEGLTNYFIQYEVPIGLLNKLLILRNYKLHFIIDDSGSMRSPTDTMMNEATIYLLRNGHTANPQQPMTRWQEAENRLHVIMDVLAYIPTLDIHLTFLNAPNVIQLSRSGTTPEAFKSQAHSQIVHAFSTIDVKYKTPTRRSLTRSFEIAASQPSPTIHYLLTDGVPTDATIDEISTLISNRFNPAANPVTLISCTNEDSESEWMKEIEERAPFCSEIDDYKDEKTEVSLDQGKGFPYTKGYWIVSQLIACINPYDLDAIDENLPFSKATLDDILGRVHTPEEYQYYFERNPHAALYLDFYNRFLFEPTFARNIVPIQEQNRREATAGYIDGKRPAIGPPNVDYIRNYLTPYTRAAAASSGGSAPPPYQP